MYKIGDQVKVSSVLRLKDFYGKIFCHPEMKRFQDSVLTIAKIVPTYMESQMDDGKPVYRVREDNGYFVWHEDMFTGKVWKETEKDSENHVPAIIEIFMNQQHLSVGQHFSIENYEDDFCFDSKGRLCIIVEESGKIIRASAEMDYALITGKLHIINKTFYIVNPSGMIEERELDYSAETFAFFLAGNAFRTKEMAEDCKDNIIRSNVTVREEIKRFRGGL